MKVHITNHSDNPLPSYETEGSAGMDIRAFLSEPVELQPSERTLIPTGLHIELPKGYEAQIRPRSGLSLKKGISMANTPGTIDSDYRGEIGIILINHGTEPFRIESGDRIAQMVIAKHETITWSNTSNLNETERGSGGFGHTGT